MIRNKTRQTIVSNEATWAKSLLQKSFGLILYNSPRTFIFQTRFGIHTLFLKYPIDVLILDIENRVVDQSVSLKPFRIFLWNPKYSTVIELAAGQIAASRTKLGDHLTLT